jgi:hypothetical protein
VVIRLEFLSGSPASSPSVVHAGQSIFPVSAPCLRRLQSGTLSLVPADEAQEDNYRRGQRSGMHGTMVGEPADCQAAQGDEKPGIRKQVATPSAALDTVTLQDQFGFVAGSDLVSRGFTFVHIRNHPITAICAAAAR